MVAVSNVAWFAAAAHRTCVCTFLLISPLKFFSTPTPPLIAPHSSHYLTPLLLLYLSLSLGRFLQAFSSRALIPRRP